MTYVKRWSVTRAAYPCKLDQCISPGLGSIPQKYSSDCSGACHIKRYQPTNLPTNLPTYQPSNLCLQFYLLVWNLLVPNHIPISSWSLHYPPRLLYSSPLFSSLVLPPPLLLPSLLSLCLLLYSSPLPIFLRSSLLHCIQALEVCSTGYHSALYTSVEPDDQTAVKIAAKNDRYH